MDQRAELKVADALSREPVDDPTEADIVEQTAMQVRVIQVRRVSAGLVDEDDGCPEENIMDTNLVEVKMQAEVDTDYLQLREVIISGFPHVNPDSVT